MALWTNKSFMWVNCVYVSGWCCYSRLLLSLLLQLFSAGRKSVYSGFFFNPILHTYKQTLLIFDGFATMKLYFWEKIILMSAWIHEKCNAFVAYVIDCESWNVQSKSDSTTNVSAASHFCVVSRISSSSHLHLHRFCLILVHIRCMWE